MRAENGTTAADTRRQINDAQRGGRQQTPGSKMEVRFPETRVHRGAVHAAVRTAMAQLRITQYRGYRNHVNGPGNGRNREKCACAIRVRDTPQQCTSSNTGETGAASRAEPHQHPIRKVRGTDVTRRPRHPAVHSPGKANLRSRGYTEHQGGSAP